MAMRESSRGGTVRIQIRGVNKVMNLFRRLPRALHNEVMDKSHDFSKFVQKSAKLRAPRWSGGGALADSITVEAKPRKRRITTTVDSPYGVFQEEGFSAHWIHKSWPTRGGKGKTFGDWLASKGYTGDREWFYVGSRADSSKSFVLPAYRKGIQKLPTFLKNAANSAFAKLDKGGK